MINRELIRQKVVHITYSYFLHDARNVDAAEKELLLSLTQAYRLYNHLLLLLLEVHRFAERMYEMRHNRAKRLGKENLGSRKFVDNKFIKRVSMSDRLEHFRNDHHCSWRDDEDFVHRLYSEIEQSEFYTAYMQSEANSFEADREVWRLIYRHLICNNDELTSILEDQNIYWNDDKIVVDTFVLKTINRIKEEGNVDEMLMPEYNDPSDRDFAVQLLRRTLENTDYFHQLIASTTRKWDINRVALMDRVILQIGLAELLSFPEIPTSVTISEYVCIARDYSTPKSSKYINATLDNIAKQLVAENKLIKY
ncbi:MAG: transcription antitermination factor NusB, partial [Bacteroidaceae bacterium]|nr:transcription antitermination factor NusB [Bacteroidaceae bacterium]